MTEPVPQIRNLGEIANSVDGDQVVLDFGGLKFPNGNFRKAPRMGVLSQFVAEPLEVAARRWLVIALQVPLVLEHSGQTRTRELQVLREDVIANG